MTSSDEDNNKLAGVENPMEEDDDSKIFPQRLMEILSDELNQEAICWLPHGRAFIIRNRKLFAATVMPRYFSRKAKYSSFTRKLNRWNFVRVSSGPEIGSYYHEFFLRDKPHLAAQMFCKNARTMLAMATTGAPEGKGAAAAQLSAPSPTTAPINSSLVPINDVHRLPNMEPHFTSDRLQHPPLVQPQPVSASLLAALSKGPNSVNANMDMKNSLLGSMPATNSLQYLERQMQLMQQEQANRLIMEQAMAVSLQQQQQHPGMQHHHAASQIASMHTHHPVAINQQVRLLQMRELMDIRMRQQQGRVQVNPRASAA